MADGFKKYFNSSTISGRANVAKVTYGAFALFYLFYRVRRGTRGTAPGSQGQHPDCVCSAPEFEEPMLPSDADPEPKKKDCPICRDRRDKVTREDPPPTPPRRRCPCEDKDSRVYSSGGHQNSNDIKHDDEAINSAEEGCTSSDKQVGSSETTNMHEAVYRALRNVIGAVMGSSSNNSSNSSNPNSVGYDSDANAKDEHTDGSSSNSDSQPMDNDDAGIVGGGYSGVSSGPSGCGTPSGPGNVNNNSNHSKDDEFIDGIGPDIYFDD